MYERHHQKPIPRRHFVRRLIAHFLGSLALIIVSLFIGMFGYHYYEDLPWNDAFLNAAMLRGGMGPVDSPQTDSGKLFAGLYALYAGLVLLIAAGVFIAPRYIECCICFIGKIKKVANCIQTTDSENKSIARAVIDIVYQKLDELKLTKK